MEALRSRRDTVRPLANLNRTIAEHYQLLVMEKKIDPDRPVLAFPISDLTANPLRPHYDTASEPDGLAFQKAGPLETGYGHRTSARLFHLEDEPISDVPYTVLSCHEEQGAIQFAIRHETRVSADGTVNDDALSSRTSGLKWWAACPPLLAGGRHNLEAFAVRDYDLRHVFGFPKDAPDESSLRDIYRYFPDWVPWCAAIRTRLQTIDRYETGYHAAFGVAADRFILIHRTATIPDLANDLRALGADDGVLLDSGGSCAIWANWANSRQGGVLASHWNFRPARGAVVFLVLKVPYPVLH